MTDFTHFNSRGEAWMVDVSDKKDTTRLAVAVGTIYMNEECFDKLVKGDMSKGDVLAVARLAGIMGAKKTSDLIPLCHILNLSKVEMDFEAGDLSVTARCTVKTVGKTGAEMEALTGVNIALLTIYDMCKAVDKSMHIENIHLESKSGGKSGDFQYEG